MKMGDQVKHVNRGFVNSNHTLLTTLSKIIQSKIQEDIGIPLAIVGKSTSGNNISLTIVGSIEASSEQVDDIDKRVTNFMNDIKNPTTLIDLLKDG